jgi:hypothetical protein
MSLGREAVSSLASAWSLLRHEPDPFAGFNVSLDGLWRSFMAIVPILPALAVIIASQHLGAVELGDAAQPPPRIGRELALAILGWALWPLLALHLARGLDVEEHYLRYQIAYNWLSLLLAFALAAPHALHLLGILGFYAAGGIGFLVYTLAIYLSWYLARIAFAVSASLAALFAAGDLTTGLVLRYLFAG